MIYKLVLLHIFVHGIWWKLPALYTTAAVLSLFMAGGVGQFEMLHALPEWRVGATVFVASQAAVLAVLFAASGTLRSYGTFEQILVHLPIMPHVRWLAFLLPSAILSSLTTVLICFPLGVIAAGMGLPIALFGITLMLGCLVSFCGYWALKRRQLPVQQVIILGLLVLEYKSIPLLDGSGSPIRMLIMTAWILGFAAIISLFVASKNVFMHDVTNKCKTRAVQVTGFTTLWFSKKVWRSRSLLGNFFTTLILASGIALICSRHPDYSIFAGLMSGLLGATIAADVRSVARRNTPPEITGLKGTAYFLLNHLSVASTMAVAATLPLLLLDPKELSIYVQLGVGICAGFFAGTLLVPTPRDIAAQCTATLLCIGLLLLPNHLASMGQLTPFIQSLGQIATALLLLLASAGIEYKRNNYRWRYHVT
jgi:hypothetical protein